MLGLALKREAEIEAAIRAYFARHPDANDTVEGIAEWWLLDPKIRLTSAAVDEALRHLVAKGVVEVFEASDGRTHYRLLKESGRPAGD